MLRLGGFSAFCLANLIGFTGFLVLGRPIGLFFTTGFFATGFFFATLAGAFFTAVFFTAGFLAAAVVFFFAGLAGAAFFAVVFFATVFFAAVVGFFAVVVFLAVVALAAGVALEADVTNDANDEVYGCRRAIALAFTLEWSNGDADAMELTVDLPTRRRPHPALIILSFYTVCIRENALL